MTILPKKELKDTAGVTRRCEEENEPIHITKNGYDCLVVMTSKTFEKYDRALKQAAQRELDRQRYFDELVSDIEAGFEDIAAGRTADAFESLAALREKHGL